jgi:hypothetical protein
MGANSEAIASMLAKVKRIPPTGICVNGGRAIVAPQYEGTDSISGCGMNMPYGIVLTGRAYLKPTLSRQSGS